MVDKKILSFDEFLDANSHTEYDTVPVKGGVVRIGSLTGNEFVEWTEMRDAGTTPEEKEAAKKESSALLIVRSLVDGDGKRIGDPTKVARLRKTNMRATEDILRAIFKLNGINQRAEAASKNDSGEAKAPASPAV